MNDKDAVNALRTECRTFFETNTFNPPTVTDVFVQVKVVLSDYAVMEREIAVMEREIAALKCSLEIRNAAYAELYREIEQLQRNHECTCSGTGSTSPCLGCQLEDLL